MQVNPLEDQIRTLHAEYCRLSGLEIRLEFTSYSRIGDWARWINEGFTVDDLRLVIRYIRFGIRDQSRRPGALKFSNLIERTDQFDLELAEAKAWRRNFDARSQTNRARVPNDAGFAPKARSNVRAVREILPKQMSAADQAALDAFREFKKSLE